jgi:hypothetical protein
MSNGEKGDQNAQTTLEINQPATELSTHVLVKISTISSFGNNENDASSIATGIAHETDSFENRSGEKTNTKRYDRKHDCLAALDANTNIDSEIIARTHFPPVDPTGIVIPRNTVFNGETSNLHPQSILPPRIRATKLPKDTVSPLTVAASELIIKKRHVEIHQHDDFNQTSLIPSGEALAAVNRQPPHVQNPETTEMPITAEYTAETRAVQMSSDQCDVFNLVRQSTSSDDVHIESDNGAHISPVYQPANLGMLIHTLLVTNLISNFSCIGLYYPLSILASSDRITM